MTNFEIVVLTAQLEHVGTVPQIFLTPSTFTLGPSGFLVLLTALCSCCVEVLAAAVLGVVAYWVGSADLTAGLTVVVRALAAWR